MFSLQAPHPHYKPSNNPVPCGDPLCKSLHPPEYKCETTEQCYYELWFQDGSSTRGVLVKDTFSFNFRDGKQLEHSLVLGLVTLFASLISITFTCTRFSISINLFWEQSKRKKLLNRIFVVSFSYCLFIKVLIRSCKLCESSLRTNDSQMVTRIIWITYFLQDFYSIW